MALSLKVKTTWKAAAGIWYYTLSYDDYVIERWLDLFLCYLDP